MHEPVYLVLNEKFNIISTVMQFIDYPQIKYLSAIGVFLAEVFHKREKKVSSGNGADVKEPEEKVNTGHW